MAKFFLFKNNETTETYCFHCPGCRYDHWVRVRGSEPVWQWNNDVEKPTISPSLLVHKDTPTARCHSLIVDGKIQFLDDCFHDLKGQTVELPNYEE